jgi:hypothetical protein
VIASDALDHQHISGEVNGADIVSKPWGYSQVWPMLQAILFWAGDTSVLLAKPLPGKHNPKPKPGLPQKHKPKSEPGQELGEY